MALFTFLYNYVSKASFLSKPSIEDDLWDGTDTYYDGVDNYLLNSYTLNPILEDDLWDGTDTYYDGVDNYLLNR